MDKWIIGGLIATGIVAGIVYLAAKFIEELIKEGREP